MGAVAHSSLRPAISRRLSTVPKLITKPNRSALEHFAVRQDHRTDGIDRAGILVAGVEDARAPFAPSTAG
jgi:hypothetical protein